MADDDSYRGSSLLRSSPGYDYDQTQPPYQEMREKREADLSLEELERLDGYNRTRQRLGSSPSPPQMKEESPSPPRASRSTAVDAGLAFGELFGPLGALDSQTGDNTYVDNLLQYAMRSVSPEKSDVGISQDPEEDAQEQTEDDRDSDHEFHVQMQRVKGRLNVALQQRDEAQDKLQYGTHSVRKIQTQFSATIRPVPLEKNNNAATHTQENNNACHSVNEKNTLKDTGKKKPQCRNFLQRKHNDCRSFDICDTSSSSSATTMDNAGHDETHRFFMECHQISNESQFLVDSLPNVETAAVERACRQLNAIRVILVALNDPHSTPEDLEHLVAYIDSLLYPLDDFLSHPPLPPHTHIPVEQTGKRGRPAYKLDLDRAILLPLRANAVAAASWRLTGVGRTLAMALARRCTFVLILSPVV
ncbi:hypothetical protein C8R47DRAFT_1238726 [Mycena vitilis]|nr:hypothetical protein C8R47DRAFT_1238726 [Mycena vitilis]